MNLNRPTYISASTGSQHSLNFQEELVVANQDREQLPA
jgi:hypothetical protein